MSPEKFEEFISLAKYNISFADSVSLLKSKFVQGTTTAVNGGLFKITEQRILFNTLELSRGHTSTVLIDDRGTPIRIDDLAALNEQWYQTWAFETNAYFNQYTKLRGARSVKALVDISN
jgi:hypothetical protein